MKVSIYLNRQRTKADGEIPVSVCVSRPPRKFYISTGLTTMCFFEGETFPRTERNHRAKTLRLNEILVGIEAITLKHSLATDDELKALIKENVFGEKKEEKTMTLYECVKEFSKEKQGSTLEKYTDTYGKVLRHDKDATLDIDVVWLEDFDKFLLNDCHLKRNSASIHLRNLRAVMNWARKHKLTTNYPFADFKIEHEETRKRNLSLETIAQLRDMPLDKYKSKYRDLFLLMFYLIGINPVDLFSATKDQLVDGRLEYTRQKTKKTYSIKVEKEAMEIIERYKGEKYLLKFHETSSLKNIRDKINLHIDKILPNVTCYYARHSWATQAYSLGVSKDVISQSLGHSMGNKITEIYIDRDPKLIDEANRKVLDALKKIGDGN